MSLQKPKLFLLESQQGGWMSQTVENLANRGRIELMASRPTNTLISQTEEAGGYRHVCEPEVFVIGQVDQAPPPLPPDNSSLVTGLFDATDPVVLGNAIQQIRTYMNAAPGNKSVPEADIIVVTNDVACARKAKASGFAVVPPQCGPELLMQTIEQLQREKSESIAVKTIR